MEFKARRRGTTSGTGTTTSAPRLAFGAPLYRDPPAGEVRLGELEAAALERIRALRALGSATAKGLRPTSDDWRTAAFEALRREGLRDYARSCRVALDPDSETDRAFAARDEVAHFALRLAHCRTEELRKWLLAREVELFRLRFSTLNAEAAGIRVAAEGARCEPVPKSERASLEPRLVECSSRRGPRPESAEYYTVGFADALELVSSRRVYLKNGLAHVPAEALATVAAAKFRTRLSESLAAAARRLPRLEADERLFPLLRGLHDAGAAGSFAPSESALPLEAIDSAAASSFPPCMRSLHERLKSAHHLRHGGRLQYGLFLKGAGVSLDDSVRFWRAEFTKNMDDQKFDKNYLYGIRYNYGKEGARKNYSPYSCAKIVNGNVGPGDEHGCPFKHCDPSALEAKLKGYGIPRRETSEMVELAKKSHYGIACGKYLDAVHNTNLELVIGHPNQYFEESKNISEGKYDLVQKPKLPKDEPAPESTAPNDWEEDFDVSMIDENHISQ